MRWLIQGGRVIDPSQGLDEELDLLIEGDRVRALAAGLANHVEGSFDRRVDARGLWVAPGFVDLHVHFRDPGDPQKEDISSGLAAAAAGGFTTVCSMPNTKPVSDTALWIERALALAKAAKSVRLRPFAAITRGLEGETLADFASLREAGAFGISDDGRCVLNAALMRRAMEYARQFDLFVSQHAEDHHLTQGAQMHEGVISARLGLRGWPREAEDIIVARDLILAEATGARYHVAHISSLGSVRLLREAKARGLRVSAEVTPHHLLLTDAALLGYNTACKVNPPLRTEEDREALLEALRDGTIDCIATDHAPHTRRDKDCEFDKAALGINGLESAFALLLDLVHQGKLSASRLIEAMSTAPTRLMQESRGGSLKEGSIADLVLIDPEVEWTLQADALRSRSSNSPWLGQGLRGAVLATFVAGRLVHQRSELPLV